MIPFEEIDGRLEKLGKTRAWLAEETGRSPGSIRAALAPNAVPKQRTALLQKALSDAIDREESKQHAPIVSAPSVHLPDRLTIECEPEERRRWQAASGGDLDSWIVETLNASAVKKIGLPPIKSLQREAGREA
jgi:hypothetical protein